jgi:cell division transport system ATP-binding protein
METVFELKNLSVFRKQNKVLSGINLSAKKGEFIFLTGRVGSGKSSLLKILYADEEVKTGEVSVIGYNLKKITNKQVPLLRRKLGIVFQDYKLLTDRNVYDNLKFVLEASGEKSRTLIKSKIQETLSFVGLKGKELRMPFELSGGEQQSVGIARALINKPVLILADEPTGNLDEKSSENIMELLRNASQNGTTVVMATHDLTLIKKYPSKVFNVEKNIFESPDNQ